MALKPCPECGESVSEKAFACPKCAFQLRKLKRGIFGKLFLWLFYLFNLSMILSMYFGISGSGAGYENMSDAEQVGTAIGTGLGIWMLMLFWAVGDVILGLLVLITRPSSK